MGVLADRWREIAGCEEMRHFPPGAIDFVESIFYNGASTVLDRVAEAIDRGKAVTIDVVKEMAEEGLARSEEATRP